MTPDDGISRSPLFVGYAHGYDEMDDLEAQINALADSGIAPSRIFVDRDEDGTVHSEALGQAMDAAARDGTALKVCRIDCLGSTLHGIVSTLRTAARSGVRISCLDEGIDTADPALARMTAALHDAAQREIARAHARVADTRTRTRRGPKNVMTTPREDQADLMLRQGWRGRKVFEVVAAMAGPNLSRSAYYQWQKKWDARNPDRGTGES